MIDCRFIYLFLTSAIFFVYCGRKEYNKVNYIKWVEKSKDFTQSNQLGDFTISAIYKPINYIIAQEYREEMLNQTDYQKRTMELGNFHYFNVKIQNKEKESALLGADKMAYYRKLEYFLTNAENDFYIISGEDTLFPKLYHFERYYNLTDYLMINLGFEPKKTGIKNKNIQLVFNGDYVGLNTQKFNFTIKENYPKLQIDEK